jgi:hypothetical protein
MRSRVLMWMFWVYLVACAADFGWHLYVFKTTGDLIVEADEVIEAMQASLFWPVDLVAQGLLVLSHATPHRR